MSRPIYRKPMLRKAQSLSSVSAEAKPISGQLLVNT